MTTPRLLPLAVLAVCATLGCSDGRLQTYPVFGVVRFSDGEPVRFGTVELLSPEHQLNARATIARDGTFALGTYNKSDGAVEGMHHAVVIQFVALDAVDGVEHDHGRLVSQRYADYATSDLTVEVAKMRNEIELVVEARGQRM